MMYRYNTGNRDCMIDNEQEKEQQIDGCKISCEKKIKNLNSPFALKNIGV